MSLVLLAHTHSQLARLLLCLQRCCRCAHCLVDARHAETAPTMNAHSNMQKHSRALARAVSCFPIMFVFFVHFFLCLLHRVVGRCWMIFCLQLLDVSPLFTLVSLSFTLSRARSITLSEFKRFRVSTNVPRFPVYFVLSYVKFYLFSFDCFLAG